MDLFQVLIDNIWGFLNISYFIDGHTIKLYYPLMFFLLAKIVLNLIFNRSNLAFESHVRSSEMRKEFADLKVREIGTTRARFGYQSGKFHSPRR